ncbi:hypothetical protein ACLI4Z_06850 [Natrialbaceae archaeon A-arb3/5]
MTGGETAETQTITLEADDSTTVEFDVTAPDEAGDYEHSIQAGASTDGDTLVVGEDGAPAPPEEPPVDEALFDAVDQDGTGDLTRNEIRDMISEYADDGEIEGEEITRDDVRELTSYYANQ